MYIYQIMSNSFGYLDIILLGMIAGFIILRLRSILGRKTGHETKVYPGFAEKKFNISKNDSKEVKENHEILEGNDKKEFLKGAEIAYETILTSFAHGDLNKLKNDLTNYPHKFILFSSTNSAKHFLVQLRNIETDWLQNIKIIVNHKRIKEQLSIIFKNIFVCENIEIQKLKELIFSESLD